MTHAAVMHQPTLLGVTEPGIARDTWTERIQLDATSWIDVTREWLGGADVVAVRLAESVPWRQGRRRMWDRMLDDPRLSYWARRDDASFDPSIPSMQHALEQTYGHRLRRPGFNYYRDGQDSVALDEWFLPATVLKECLCSNGEMAHNVLGTELAPCSLDPLTGFYRDGCCNSGGDDAGVHAVCVVTTAEFLEFSAQVGNDLSTPMPQYGFPGLNPGDQWCLCAQRWVEAFDAGMAPKVVLEATHARVLEWATLDDLRTHSA